MTLRAFQCFEAGTHTDMSGRATTFSLADISAIAAGYSPSRKAAPLVLGHPEDDSRASSYGTVRGLVAEGPALFAIADVSNELQQLVRAGRYKNVSSSLHLPGARENPGIGYYLRHVGFLGAMQPAVKGMQPLAFAVQFDEPNDSLAEHQTAAFAAACGVSPESQQAQIYRVARSLSKAVPALSVTGAAIRVERALYQ